MTTSASAAVVKDASTQEKTSVISSPKITITTPESTTGETQWIFGYGSLVWKVDFPYVRRLAGYVKGYKRRFWLSSEDHRGLPEAPGRVCTLVASDDAEEKVWGLAYEIPADDAVRRHLDHRERGGYSRREVLFHLRSTEDPSSDVPAQIPVVVYIAGDDVKEYLGPQPLNCIADVIAVAEGPSGHNSDYLLNLADAMRNLAPEAEDDHLYGLERLVRERLDEKRRVGERNIVECVVAAAETPLAAICKIKRRKRRSASISLNSDNGDEGGVDERRERTDRRASKGVLGMSLDDRQEE